MISSTALLILMLLKPAFSLYFLVFAVFTRVSLKTMELAGIPVLPVLFAVSGLFLAAWNISAGTLKPANLRSFESRLLSLFFLFYLSCGLINAGWNRDTVSITYYLAANFLLVQLILLFADRLEVLENIFMAACLGGSFAAVVGICQYLASWQHPVQQYGLRAAGWWQNPGDFAMILSVAYLVSFYFVNSRSRLRRLAAYFTQCTVLPGILLSLTRAGLILVLLITALNCRAFLKKNCYPAALAITCFILSCLFFRSEDWWTGIIGKVDFERLAPPHFAGAFENRLDLAGAGLFIFARNPLFGTGFGNLLPACGNQFGTEVYPHNIYVSMTAESGIFTLMYYLVLLCYLLATIAGTCSRNNEMRNTLKNFLIVLAVMGFFNHQLLFEKHIAIFLACIPAFCRLNRPEAGKNSADGGETCAHSHDPVPFSSRDRRRGNTGQANGRTSV